MKIIPFLVIKIFIKNGKLKIQQISQKTFLQYEQVFLKFLKDKEKEETIVFPKERRAFLIPLITFFREMDELRGRTTPPHTIAKASMLLADYRKSNTEEGYLTEKEISRDIQKYQRELREGVTEG